MVLSVSPFTLAEIFLVFPQPVASICVCSHFLFRILFITKFWFISIYQVLNCNACRQEECGFHLIFIVYPFCFILFESMILFLTHFFPVNVIKYYQEHKWSVNRTCILHWICMQLVTVFSYVCNCCIETVTNLLSCFLYTSHPCNPDFGVRMRFDVLCSKKARR